MLRRIFKEDVLLAIIIEPDFQRPGISFFTPEYFSQQLGYMNRPKGHKIPPHVHNIIERKVQLTQEVLYVKSGCVRVDLYTRAQEYCESHVLRAGAVILLADGGHGFYMLETSEIIEIKQGPYSPDEDKKHFEEVEAEKITIAS
jgi:hypothetical protein